MAKKATKKVPTGKQKAQAAIDKQLGEEYRKHPKQVHKVLDLNREELVEFLKGEPDYLIVQTYDRETVFQKHPVVCHLFHGNGSKIWLGTVVAPLEGKKYDFIRQAQFTDKTKEIVKKYEELIRKIVIKR